MCCAPNTFWFWVLGLFMHFHCYWGRGVSLFCFSMGLSFSFWCIWLLYTTVWMDSTLEQAQVIWNPDVSFSILASNIYIYIFNENFWLRFTFSFSLCTNCMYFAFEYYNHLITADSWFAKFVDICFFFLIKFSYKIGCNLRLQTHLISFYWKWILTNPLLNYIFFLYPLYLQNFKKIKDQ